MSVITISTASIHAIVEVRMVTYLTKSASVNECNGFAASRATESFAVSAETGGYVHCSWGMALPEVMVDTLRKFLGCAPRRESSRAEWRAHAIETAHYSILSPYLQCLCDLLLGGMRWSGLYTETWAMSQMQGPDPRVNCNPRLFWPSLVVTSRSIV